MKPAVARTHKAIAAESTIRVAAASRALSAATPRIPEAAQVNAIALNHYAPREQHRPLDY